MGEVIVIKIILLHLIAEAIVCFLGMITMNIQMMFIPVGN